MLLFSWWHSLHSIDLDRSRSFAFLPCVRMSWNSTAQDVVYGVLTRFIARDTS